MVAINLLKNSMAVQQEQMMERIRRRKLELARKKREMRNDMQNQTMPTSLFDSPNLSRITDGNDYNNDKTMDAELMENSILNNLDKDLDENEGMPSEGEDLEDDPEKLAELDEKKEELIEELLDLALSMREEV